MPIVALALICAALAVVSDPVRVAEGKVITSERGTCIEGPHEPGRVRRLPGTAVSSSKPRNPSEDSYVHCESAELGTSLSTPERGRSR